MRCCRLRGKGGGGAMMIDSSLGFAITDPPFSKTTKI